MTTLYTTSQAFNFAQARISGRRREALRILHEVLGVEYDDSSIERGDGIHSAPSPASGAPLWDLSANGIYPEDVYSSQGLRFYATGDDSLDRMAYDIVRASEGLVNASVTVYRAVEKDGATSISPGDWVTTVKRYAQDHGERSITGKSKILQARVRTCDLFTSGDSWLEYGYHPQPSLPKLVRGALTLRETISGTLEPQNMIYSKLSAEQKSRLLQDSSFAASMSVNANVVLGHSDAQEIVKIAEQSGQFESELQAIRKNQFRVHKVDDQVASFLVKHGESVAVLGGVNLWQQNCQELGQEQVIHELVAQFMPNTMNDRLFMRSREFIDMYDLMLDCSPSAELHHAGMQ